MKDITKVMFGILMTESFVIGIIGISALRRRKVPGAITFLLLSVASICYTFGYGMEMISPTVDQVNFWGKFQYLGISFLPFIWTLFALGFTKSKRVKNKNNPLPIGLMLLIPLIKVTLRWTSDYQSWIYGVSSFDDMVKRADLALYLAKERGRNRIEVYSKE